MMETANSSCILLLNLPGLLAVFLSGNSLRTDSYREDCLLTCHLCIFVHAHISGYSVLTALLHHQADNSDSSLAHRCGRTCDRAVPYIGVLLPFRWMMPALPEAN